MFIASRSLHQDPILERLEGKSELLLSPDQLKREYVRLQKYYGYDLPLFYFGIERLSSYPKVYSMTPQAASFVQKITAQTANPESLERFMQLVDSLDLPENQVRTLFSAQSVSGVASWWAQLGIQDQDLEKNVQALGKRKSFIRHFVPVLRWYGRSNQYDRWLSRVLQGDFGRSVVDDQPVRSKVYSAIYWTLLLNLTALVLIFTMGIVLGYFAARSNARWVSRLISVVSYIFFAVPIFWLATLMIVFFTTDDYGSWTHWFASVGVMEDCSGLSIIGCFGENFRYMILPILCLTLPSLAYIIRQVYVGITSEKKARYVLFLKSLGHPKSAIFFKRILPNALIPIITLIGQAIPALISGSVVLEIIFNIPGVGRLLYMSIFAQDWNVVMLMVLIVAVMTMLGYLVVDLLYKLVNPKIEIDR